MASSITSCPCATTGGASIISSFSVATNGITPTPAESYVRFTNVAAGGPDYSLNGDGTVTVLTRGVYYFTYSLGETRAPVAFTLQLRSASTVYHAFTLTDETAPISDSAIASLTAGTRVGAFITALTGMAAFSGSFTLLRLA